MIYPEIGNFSLILAFCMACVLGIFPIAGVHFKKGSWVAVARPVAFGLFFFVLIAYACLTYAFIQNDFSVAYVASNSNSQLPLVYRISGVWGSHEGSLLLWIFILAFWINLVAFFSRTLPVELVARVLGVLGLVSIGFLSFILFTSNPFLRLFPVPFDGRDLNPLLQDPGMAIHPPMLYMGYVGFSVAFAFAVAALINGKLDSAWTRWARPWTNMAWVFLTVGIVLGSWWAYYELGWGGWWFWDPVENASFMPWLVGTALIHSLSVTEKRGLFKNWTILLSILAFSLSLLGTFLVRSGVLTSVHAFASDPTRGIFILVFLTLAVGGSLTLFAARASQIKTEGHFHLLSKDAFLLFNNILLVSAAATILVGTLYPLVIDALNMGKISVGPPYFNSVFIPLTGPLALMVGVGAMLHWGKDKVERVISLFSLPLICAVFVGFLLAMLPDSFSWAVFLGLFLAVWTALTTVMAIQNRLRNKKNKLEALGQLPAGFWAMSIAHIGIAVFIVGITLTSFYSIEKDVGLVKGESISLGGYDFRFLGTERVSGPNYDASRGHFSVTRNGKTVTELFPEKRIYRAQKMPMTEAGIDAGLTRDLFVALGEPIGSNDKWAVRVYLKPYIRWIWLGGLIMAFGGLVGVFDRRYRVTYQKPVEA